jgi:DNA-binding GntR family transcriptional regulator
LKLNRLREDYRASIGTLRELPSRLATQKLVVAEGQRGFEVAPVSAENLGEIAALRLLLESHALIQSFAAGDMDWEGRVVAAYHKLSVVEKRLLSGQPADPPTWKRCDWEFHHALSSDCGSNALLETHAPAHDKYLHLPDGRRHFSCRDSCSRTRECVSARQVATRRRRGTSSRSTSKPAPTSQSQTESSQLPNQHPRKPDRETRNRSIEPSQKRIGQ